MPRYTSGATVLFARSSRGSFEPYTPTPVADRDGWFANTSGSNGRLFMCSSARLACASSFRDGSDGHASCESKRLSMSYSIDASCALFGMISV